MSRLVRPSPPGFFAVESADWHGSSMYGLLQTVLGGSSGSVESRLAVLNHRTETRLSCSSPWDVSSRQARRRSDSKTLESEERTGGTIAQLLSTRAVGEVSPLVTPRCASTARQFLHFWTVARPQYKRQTSPQTRTKPTTRAIKTRLPQVLGNAKAA